MLDLTLQTAAKACGGKLLGAEGRENKELTCAVIDSRKLEEGGLFLAAKGEKVDGHQFIGQVFEKGAACVVTEKTPEEVECLYGVAADEWGPYILVEDSYRALKQIAAYYRSILSIPVVGITGSVGKTSTKEFIAGVLSEKYKVLKTEGNYNNEIGLPLTLLRIHKEHEAAVVEMGISDFGEMSRLGEMARPDICVITNIGQCHLENLHNRAGIFKAKTEIFDYLQEGGRVCLNGEDDLLFEVKQVQGRKVYHFGISESPDFAVYATDIENLGLLGSRAVMHIGTKAYPVEIPLPGGHMVINAMAAATVGSLLNLTPEEIQKGIQKVEPVSGRSRLIRLADKLLIDDCYNANPVSMKAAVDLLMTATSRKTAILGDMFELGEDSENMHAEVGAYAIEQGVDALYCVGEKSRFMYDAALERYDGSQDIRYFENREELLESLPLLIQEGDTILIKASHGMGFSAIVDSLRS
ncbi:MAG: UDP-N-acetylmuramoyl-tripeptide--D-alanyl-D-alanine ligase [Lachnospiraceae bacterium]|nr:UDP-N-acetylmuramoyl-tripeptide--D-alanyl-D-alanine ligase [Lachnospiraceae bacterium]